MKRTSNTRGKRRLNQSTTVTAMAIIAIASLVMMFGIQMWNLSASNSLNQIIAQRDELIQEAARFRNASSYLTQEVRAFAANGNQVHFDNYKREVNTDKNREHALETMRSIGLTDQEEAIMSEISSLSNGLIPLEEEAMALTKEHKNATAISLLYGDKYQASYEKISQDTEKFNASIKNRMDSKLDQNSHIMKLSYIASVLCLILVVAIQIIFILYIRKELLSPMLLIGQNLMQMAEGNFDEEIELPVDNTDVGKFVQVVAEIKQSTKAIIQDIGHMTGELAIGNFTASSKREDAYVGVYRPILESMTQLKMNLVDTLLQIRDASEQVAAGANQVSDSAQSLAQGATEQSSQVEELASGISRVSAQAGDNAENSQKANELASSAGQVAQSATADMEKLGEAMQEISQSSEKIRNVIKVIDNIAFQTNILALNAAVESARAGAAGKGFAVVADEVRNLAGKSAEAAKSTTDMIEHALAAVARGEELARRTDEAFKQLTAKVGLVVETVDEISSASVDQAEQSRQFAEGVDQISAVTQTIAAASEESAATSEELSGQANLMQSLISHFRFADVNSSEDTDYQTLMDQTGIRQSNPGKEKY